jgi:hypothetical protein
MCSERRPVLLSVAAALAAVWMTATAGYGAAQKFYPDDPIARDRDDVMDASSAEPRELSEMYDFLDHTFGSPGDEQGTAAVNVNTLDEVPDSSWFTNRIGAREMAIGDVVRGPDTDRTFRDNWTITQGKGPGGLQPGFRAVNDGDPTKQLYQIEFDPPTDPELATGAEVIGTAIYHALGYTVVDMYLVTVDPAKVQIAEDATVKDTNGRRKFTKRDLEGILALAARTSDGGYRALASRFVEGKPMGPFEYHGTRADDPNDIHPHEHRRELRGNRVFAAWLNHDDSRAINTLDMLVPKDGRQVFRHHMYDFGATLGSATRFPDPPENGHEYYVDKRPSLLTLATFGLYVKPWVRRSYPDAPTAAGSFTHVGFDPVKWRANYPNPAFNRMRPDDAFWAARRVAAFTDEQLRAIAVKGRYSDEAAAAHIADTLIKRRDIVARTWLAGVNPVVDPVLTQAGALSFRNAAKDAGVAPAASSYSFQWSRFDNAAQTHTAVGGAVESTDTRTTAPPAVLDGSQYISVAIVATHPDHPAWAKSLQVYFRRTAGGWQTVGIENR